MQRPAVREKVEALRHAKTTEPGLIASREWIEAQFVITLDRVSRGLETGDMDSNARENARLMISGLMQFAKFKGWIVDRKQLATAKLDLRNVPSADLHALFGEYLEALEPGEQERLRRIAAGGADGAVDGTVSLRRNSQAGGSPLC
jgi:hypothetical protein